MFPSEFGRFVEEEWRRVKLCRGEEVDLDGFQVMPNHFHAILWIYGTEPTTVEKRQFAKPQAGSLGMIVGDFKAEVTRRVRAARGDQAEVWQTRFNDHIIRNDKSLENIRRYIADNPANWSKDEFHPEAPQKSSNPNAGRYRR
jgi:REP element-mobilizing transposase RayT